MFTSEKERLKARYNAGREANHILSANHTPSNSAGADAELPPPAYDSHYSSPSVSASSSAQPPPDARLPAPLALPEKPNRSATLNSVSDTYSHSTTPVTPAGTIVPFPHSSFSNPSVVLQPTATDLNRSGSFASSSFTHTSYSDPSVASHSGATDLNRASSFATSRGTNEFTTSSAASIAPTSSGSGLKSGQVTPPPSFLRTPPRDLTYPSFPSTVLFTADNDLKKGFPREPPQSIVNPHPFATHDICEQDWLWFLSAVKGVAATGGIDFTSLPIVAPTAAHLAVSFGLGRLVNMGIEAHVKSKRRGPLAQVFDTWNQSPRKEWEAEGAKSG
ncbi:hypothetical protein EUX98_g3989 [Antrodiella citrinella]|uniref:Uncharacterized protein n=1 Tax=Antrodiella citrinella TaxID=2447956 RepID=A0A4S4MV76_9APHY|nr:hypothetical protein EUX98_g3989 [Antrodiella citrinella]